MGPFWEEIHAREHEQSIGATASPNPGSGFLKTSWKQCSNSAQPYSYLSDKMQRSMNVTVNCKAVEEIGNKDEILTLFLDYLTEMLGECRNTDLSSNESEILLTT